LANWIENVVRPRIRSLLAKRDTPQNLWVKCPETGEMVFHKDLEANQFVFPNSGYHQRIDARTRFRLFFDDEHWEMLPSPLVPIDPLRFRDERRYTERLKAAKAKTGLDDAVMLGAGTVDGVALVAAAQDFDFMGGSLGMAAAEAIIAGAKAAVERHQPYVVFASSGGARMQEGILALMQLPRTTIAIDSVKEAGLPYIVVLTNPTTGGVTASYAMLGDMHLAEPGALVGFAGPRVIEQTIREKLPEGFQRAEYLRDHGMVDIVVHRHKLRETVARLCRLMMKMPPPNHPPLAQGTNGAARNGGGNGAAGEPMIAPPKSDQTQAAAN
jgi:acetyl-CoA carboxylase carboxyl transferase subunit beta